MANPKALYLYKLLNFYMINDGEEFIYSKIRSMGRSKSIMFCCKCCKTFIPKINCNAKYNGSELSIECLECKEKYNYTQIKQQNQ